MRGTLDRTVLVGAGLFAALLVAIAALTYRNTSQLNEDARWVAHTNEVLDLTGEVLLAIVDAETGQRGFLLTGRDEYLEPYNSARKRLEGLLATLDDRGGPGLPRHHRPQEGRGGAGRTGAVDGDECGAGGSLDAGRHVGARSAALCRGSGRIPRGAFARIWTLDPEAGLLELQASAGLYTHIDGPHGRVPVGKLKIGLIAQERKAHLTNAVVGDPRVPEQEWAKREGLVAFAGYPLTVEDRLVGVMAMFARHELTPHTPDAMAAVADQIALGIERKRAEQEVARLLALEQERSERLRQVAAASLTINSATTPTSVVDVIRAEAKRIIGTTHSEVSLQSEEELPADALRAALIGRGGRLLGHIYLAGKTKGDFTQHDKAILIQLSHMAAVAYDNARLYEVLRESDRRKDEFLATLAHELRNPLAPIRNSIHVMRLAGHDRATIDGSRAMIERQVQQMVRLVDDLLDLSRISRGQIGLRTEPVELATVLTSAVETSRPLIEQSGHELEVTLPQEPIPLVADPTRLAQAFSNLLNNAAKYTERGGHIWLSAQCDDGCVTVRVRDSGVGIPTEMLPRIFEMFTQVDHSLERAQGGLGIGLTLVKRLVESTVAASKPTARGRSGAASSWCACPWHWT